MTVTELTSSEAMMLNEALVVESRFASRHALINDLRTSAIAREIVEARSVRDAFTLLQSRDIDACVLGPALSREVAVEFVSQARFESKNPACAFIAVLEPGSKSLPGLRAAGVDGTLTTPYSSKSFSQICRAASASAKRRAQRPQGVIWANAVSRKNEALIAHLTQHGEAAEKLDVALMRTVDGLQEIAQRIAKRELKLQRSGHPSLATADAIRLAIEAAFPEDAQVQILGSDDNLFVTALVEWFGKLIDQPFAVATEELRQSLLRNISSAA